MNQLGLMGFLFASVVGPALAELLELGFEIDGPRHIPGVLVCFQELFLRNGSPLLLLRDVGLFGLYLQLRAVG